MKQKSKLSKIAKVTTGAAFLFFCLLNLKTVVVNNGKIERSNSKKADACWDKPTRNNGDCIKRIDGVYFCQDSWYWHDCVQGYS